MKSICTIILLIPIIALSAQQEEFHLRDNGTIPVWIVAGPFPNGNTMTISEGCIGYFKDYLTAMGGENNVIPTEGEKVTLDDGKQIIWKTAFSNDRGVLNYEKILGVKGLESAVTYAFCQLVAGEERKVILKIRSDDGVRVWLNQQMIHDHHVERMIESEEDQVSVILKKGNNPLLVKVDKVVGRCKLAVTVFDMKGKPVKGISTSISTIKPVKGKILDVNLQATTLIIKTAQGDRQVIQAEIISGGLKNLICRITKEDWEKPQEMQINNIPIGKFSFQLEVPVIKKRGPAQVLLQAQKDQSILKDVVCKKPLEWTVYLVQHVHTDIGYTRPQTEIMPEHLRFIDYALDFCDLTDDYPDDAKFRWTCEVSWAVREYLKRRPQSQIERLKKRVSEGRIEIAGMYLHMSEIATENALAASLQPLREIKALGLPVQTAIQNDVNGIGWCMADYLSSIGVKYLSMGINPTRSVLPFKKPTAFWWESPSGKRLLAFRADDYHVGNRIKLHEADLAYFGPKLSEHLQSLEERDYPFDRFVVNYSGYYTDNSPPSTKACDLVKSWNETYTWPKLRIATVHEFLQYVEKHHKDELPVYRVAWPDWWTDGFGSAVRETSETRRSHNETQMSQGLLTMAALLGTEISPETKTRVAEIQDALIFYDEHTFGAAESISDPMCENSLVQWGEKSSYIWDAVKKEGMLREEALGLLQPYLPRANVPTISVFNTLNLLRSGLVEVFIDHEVLPVDSKFQIIDSETGMKISAQPLRSRSEGTYWALWAKDVPPLGYRTLRIEVSEGKRESEIKSESISAGLENKYYRLRVNQKTGAITSLYDKEMKTELVDEKAFWDWGQFIYERLLEGRSFKEGAFERESVKNVKIESDLNGAIWKSIRISADIDGCEEPNGVALEIRLYEPEKRIELFYRIRKQRITEPEACYVAFPFKLPDAKIVYEAQGGLVTPGETQLPGSSSDWHGVQKFVAIRNENGQIIFGSSQIPLVQFSDINLGKWQYVTQVEKPHIYSWVMNNYWFTNFRAFQEGEFKWSYFITSNSDTTNSLATNFSWSSCMPLIPRVLLPGSDNGRKLSLSTLHLSTPNVVLVNAKPAYQEKAIILHLREVDGKSTSLFFNNKVLGDKIKSVDEVNVLEETLTSGVSEVFFVPYEVKFVKLLLKD